MQTVTYLERVTPRLNAARSLTTSTASRHETHTLKKREH